MKNSNKNKTSAIIWYVCAVLNYVSAIIHFMCDNKSLGVMWFCLGSAALCMGSAFLNKMKKEETNGSDSDNSQDK